MKNVQSSQAVFVWERPMRLKLEELERPFDLSRLEARFWDRPDGKGGNVIFHLRLGMANAIMEILARGMGRLLGRPVEFTCNPPQQWFTVEVAVPPGAEPDEFLMDTCLEFADRLQIAPFGPPELFLVPEMESDELGRPISPGHKAFRAATLRRPQGGRS